MPNSEKKPTISTTQVSEVFSAYLTDGQPATDYARILNHCWVSILSNLQDSGKATFQDVQLISEHLSRLETMAGDCH